ncbi:MAG: ATP-dependent helicase HrpB [Deltaproteobacteria bacterium]|nr:ATP-dependent helicase HrpB [Deltaproteobacteria bacterium]
MRSTALGPALRLPIDDALPGIVSALARAGAVVVSAPPGSGKTTRLPVALLDAGLLEGGVCLIQEPRRIAARSAARRVAEERGWQLGREVGYQVRFDRRCGPGTRLLYVTDGILAGRLQADPSLAGVAAVVLDEFHERSVEGDLSLAFLREIRGSLRPDLKVAVLSATLDAAPVAEYLGAEVCQAPGRPYPVDVLYLDRPDLSPLPQRVAAGIRRLWARRPDGGDLLAFLPGAGDIRHTARELATWAAASAVEIRLLHGDLPADQQDAVLRRPLAGPGRVILATNVAETSVTVEGLRAVVDSGLAKTLRHDIGTGLDRLELTPISRASADQRAGRAGRLGPGTALRLWTKHEDLSRAPQNIPEIQRVDLARAALEILAWGARPETFSWLQAPDAGFLAGALNLLERLGALSPRGGLTAEGEALRRLPLHPRLGRLVLTAARRGHVRDGATLAALTSERDILVSGRSLGPTGEAHLGDSDLLHRKERLEEAEAVGFDSGRLRRWGMDASAAAAVARARDQIERLCRELAPSAAPSPPADDDLLRLLLAAYPDRVARRRTGSADRFLLASGRGAVLAAESQVRRSEFVVAVRLEAGQRRECSEETIRWASRVEPEWLSAVQPLVRRTRTWFDADSGRVTALEGDYYENLCVSERAVAPEPVEAARRLAEAVLPDPVGLLRPGRAAEAFIARCRFLAGAMPELELPRWDEAEWSTVLQELARGKRSLPELRSADLLSVLRAHLSWSQRQALDREAPEHVEVPSGSRVALRYRADGSPSLSVKIQEVFGWRRGPRLAGDRVAVVLHLLGPHGRPLQITSDLESFWANAYPEIRKEMRGRYPKHRWPEDPWSAPPSRRTTNLAGVGPSEHVSGRNPS